MSIPEQYQDHFDTPETRSAHRASDYERLDLLTLYIDEIAHEVLTPDQELDLGQRKDAGMAAAQKISELEQSNKPVPEELISDRQDGESAFASLYRHNLLLVVSIASKYPRPVSISLSDLIQEGNIGLLRAVEKFDWRKGFRFSTYACFWIKQAVQTCLDENLSTIRVPRAIGSSLRADLRHYENDHSRLSEGHREIVRTLSTVSLDKMRGDAGVSLINFIPAQGVEPENTAVNNVQREHNRKIVEDLLSQLPELHRKVLMMRYGITEEPKTRTQIGQEIGLSDGTVSKVIKDGINALKEYCELRSISFEAAE